MGKGSGGTRNTNKQNPTLAAKAGKELRGYWDSPSQVNSQFMRVLERARERRVLESGRSISLNAGFEMSFSRTREFDGAEFLDANLKLPTGEVKNVASVRLGTRDTNTIDGAYDVAFHQIRRNAYYWVEKLWNS